MQEGCKTEGNNSGKQIRVFLGSNFLIVSLLVFGSKDFFYKMAAGHNDWEIVAIEHISSRTSAGTGGTDTAGKSYTTIDEFWQELREETDKADWYMKANEYWQRVSPTLDGVLGGFSSLHKEDIRGSARFLRRLKSEGILQHTNAAADCGAGIGRVTRALLINEFQRVDVVEQNSVFLEAFQKEMQQHNPTQLAKLRCICQPLQLFQPQPAEYDVIWIQWVLGHLTDDDLVGFLKRCKEGISSGGVIVVKENISKNGFVVDRDDNSITRSVDQFRELFQKAGLKIVKETPQTNFPREIFKVLMFALSSQAD